MRKLIITSGIPASGKSTELYAMGLNDYKISMDDIRLTIASPEMNVWGKIEISQRMNDRVWALQNQFVNERMNRGETLVVDSTNTTSEDFKYWLKLALLHRYQAVCLDFSQTDINVIRERNLKRSPVRQVPDISINRMYENLQKRVIPLEIPVIEYQTDLSHREKIQDFLSVPTKNLDQYKRVIHIGDLQGCCSVLKDFIKQMGGIKEDDFWIFVGDALDRGDENGQVMKFLLEEVLIKPNVVFLWGNHEDHIHKHATGQEHVSDEYKDMTIPQLKRAGIEIEDLEKFCTKLSDVFLYKRGSHNVLVTHAGLSSLPQEPWMISKYQYSHGTGYYDDPVDERWEKHAPENWIQVHGHRNNHYLPVQASERSFNLESSVEFGGNLRCLVLDNDGFHPYETANKVFRPFVNRKHRKMTIIPQWMQLAADHSNDKPYQSGALMEAALKSSMIAHSGVKQKSFAKYPHVVAFNFTKSVFFDKSWDDIAVKARGLFVNDQTHEIVSRGYDKFFNVGEVEETKMQSLEQNLKFPIVLYEKENGFLGNLGYDSVSDSLFIASKSTPEGEFAEIFQDILFKTIPQIALRESLKRFLRDTESCMTFEVIDPVRDPHMIEYNAPKLVLLDVLHRSSTFEKLDYANLQRVAEQFGFECKKKKAHLKDSNAFTHWYANASENINLKIEGYVIEDSAGFQTKVKLPFYSFWKFMRSVKDTIVRERSILEDNLTRQIARIERIDFKKMPAEQAENKKAELVAQAKEKHDSGTNNLSVSKQQEISAQMNNRGMKWLTEDALAFRSWCLNQTDQTLQSDIIQLRNEFLKTYTMNTNKLSANKQAEQDEIQNESKMNVKF